MELILKSNIDNPDDFYQELIDSQRDLNEDQVQLMNAKLILLLTNHIGDRGIISQALNAAHPSTVP
jgi:hypothetical protein